MTLVLFAKIKKIEISPILLGPIYFSWNGSLTVLFSYFDGHLHFGNRTRNYFVIASDEENALVKLQNLVSLTQN